MTTSLSHEPRYAYFICHHPWIFFPAVGSWTSSGWLSRGKSDPGIYSQTSLFADSTFANFAYSWTFICNPPNKYTWGFLGHSRTCVEQRKIWAAHRARSPLSRTKVTLSSCFSGCTVTKCPFHGLFCAFFLKHFYALRCWFCRANRPHAWCWSTSVPKCKKAGVGLTQKTRVSEELPYAVSDSVVGRVQW